MSQLGNQTIGNSFTVGGSFGDAAGGPYTVPSPGIFVNDINVHAQNNGSSSTDRLYVWQASGSVPGTWLIRGSGTFNMSSTYQWWQQTSLAVNTAVLDPSGFIPGGTVIWIGIYSSTGILAYKGNSTGTTELGNTADGSWSDHGPASGFGVLGAYIDYTLASGAYVNTGTSASPVWTPASSITVNTGTSASPVWTQATFVGTNTGTSGSPVWTPGA